MNFFVDPQTRNARTWFMSGYKSTPEMEKENPYACPAFQSVLVEAMSRFQPDNWNKDQDIHCVGPGQLAFVATVVSSSAVEGILKFSCLHQSST